MEQTTNNIDKGKTTKRGSKDHNYRISEDLDTLLSKYPNMDMEGRSNIINARDIFWRKFISEKEKSQIKQ